MNTNPENVDWDSDPDFVMEEKLIQGREKVRLMVVILGERKQLKCDIAFAKEPVGQIVWRVDGRLVERTTRRAESYSGELLIEETFAFNVTKDLARSSIACEYTKGVFAVRVEAIIRVFELNIVSSTESCTTCDSCNLKVSAVEVHNPETPEFNVKRRIEDKVRKFNDQDKTLEGFGNLYSFMSQVETTILDQIKVCDNLKILRKCCRHYFCSYHDKQSECDLCTSFWAMNNLPSTIKVEH